VSEHGTAISQTIIDAKVIALYSTLPQELIDKYERIALAGTYILYHIDLTNMNITLYSTVHIHSSISFMLYELALECTLK
jgi:hypothetical protein